MRTEHYLFHVQGIVPKPMAKVHAVEVVLKPFGSFPLTVLRRSFWCTYCVLLFLVGVFMSYFVFCC